MERSLDFYVQGLGLDCVSRRRVADEYIRRVVQVAEVESIEVAMLAIQDGEIAIELLEYFGCDGCPATVSPCDPGSGHLCLFVDDIDKAWQRALNAGGRPRSAEPVRIDNGPYAGGYGVYLKDPDGYTVELLQLPPKGS